jgi:hydrophobic/amphiphilic exporter-1 (mainly G- bacteria), HAE1 family
VSLPGMAARHRVTFLMIFLLMAGAGAFGLTQMGLDYFPKVDLGEINIVTVLPGAGPGEVEALISEPIEDAVTGIEDVNTVESESRASLSTVSVKVSLGADIDRVEEDIKEAVDRIQSSLPENASDPVVFALESSMKSLVIVSFSSEIMNSAELRRLVEDEIQPVLSRVSGIATADISGGEIRQINVLVDPVLIWERGVSLSQMYGALAAVSSDQPGGDIDDDGVEISVSVRSGFHDLGQIRELVVGSHGGIPVRLGDVAVVEDGFQEQTNLTTLNGRSTVLIIFRKSSNANTVNTCRALEEEIGQVSEDFSGQLSTDIVYSQADFVRSSMSSLLVTGLQAILLAALVLVLFLGSTVNAGIVSISMPLSFITTFASMYFFGVNLNIMSLAGLSIAIGMIVDNSVVVLENIHRLRRGGAETLAGAERGANQVGMAVTASTLTTVAVFIPMLFVKGMTGQIFRDLSITIASALFISLFVSMTLIPLLAGMSPHLVKTHRKGSPLDVVQHGIHRLEERYAQAVSWCLSHKRSTILPVILLFLVSVLLARQIPTSFIPDVREGTMSIIASAPPGTNLHITDSIAMAMVDSITAVIDPGDIEHSSMTVGRSNGIAAAFGSDAPSRIDLTLYFADRSELSRSVDEYQEVVRRVLEGVPGLEYTITTGMPVGNEYPVQIAVYGPDLQDLRRKGDLVKQALRGIPGTVDHVSSLDEWVEQIEFTPDPAVLSQRGASPAMISSEITLGVLGLDASTYYEEGYGIDVHIGFPGRDLASRERIMGLPVAGAPLGSWGVFESTLVPQVIGHRDRSRAVLVSCKIQGRALGDIGADVESMMDTLDLEGSRWELLGDIPDQKESFASMSLAIIVAILLVYMVMASQFESLLEPFMLIFEIPMALIGVILIHIAAGITLGLTSLVGILMLAGIVVNNGIVLIDFANQLRRQEGLSPEAAVLDAGRKRMRPILMTAGTTVLALVPLALTSSGSSALWSPMALTVIGGMLVATPLTLLVLPVLYVSMDGWHRRRKTDRVEKQA